MTASGANATLPNVDIRVEVATEERADHCCKYRWVKLPGLISRVTAHAIRAEIERCTKPARKTSMSAEANTFDCHKMPSEHSAFLAQVGPSRQLADVALRLTGLPAVRFFVDSALVRSRCSMAAATPRGIKICPRLRLTALSELLVAVLIEELARSPEGTHADLSPVRTVGLHE